ncbi:MAG: class I SAM-dependent methyltransferase [Halorhodospira sp.]
MQRMSGPHRACPLCAGEAVLFHRGQRTYYRCPSCALIHVPSSEHLDAAAERAVYDQHENEVGDPGYHRFLARLVEPLLDEVAPPARALDFGCGPGPALAAMLAKAGLETRLYDPFYFPDPAPLSECYQVITATEVVEHLAQPGYELERLWSLLEPGGWLGLMTKRQPLPASFPDWHYLRDPTHIAFFHDETFRYLADCWEAELRLPRGDVALLRKSGA